LEDFENRQNNKPRYFEPHPIKRRHNEGKSNNRPHWKSPTNKFSSGNSSRPVK